MTPGINQGFEREAIVCPRCKESTVPRKWNRYSKTGAQRWQCRNDKCRATFIDPNARAEGRDAKLLANVDCIRPVLVLLGLGFGPKQTERATGINWDSTTRVLRQLALNPERAKGVLKEAQRTLDRSKAPRTRNLYEDLAEFIDGYSYIPENLRKYSRTTVRRMGQNEKGRQTLETLIKDAVKLTKLNLTLTPDGDLVQKPAEASSGDLT
jgi:transposase-like protein